MKTQLQTFRRTCVLLAVCLLAGFGSAKAACSAHFTWSQTSPNTIAFVSNSTGISSSVLYEWNFGDGNVAYVNPVSHVYSAPGRYVATLFVYDSLNSCNSSFNDTITVTGTVICNITGTMSTGNASCPSCADGYASINVTGGTAPYFYSWNGGGSTASQTDNALLPGTYTVVVRDTNACTATFTATIGVNSTTCQASFTYNLTTSPTGITFSSTSTGTTGGTVYYWTFGDGTSGYGSSITNVYANPGHYTVCLQISDSANTCSSTFCDTVNVTGSTGCNIYFNMNTTGTSCSTCSDGTAVAYPNGGTAPYAYSWSTGATTSGISGLANGTYTLCITDASGCNVCQAVTISSTHCAAMFTIRPDSMNTGDYIATNYSTGSYGTTPVHCVWSWGDGTSDSTLNPSHTYATAGLYTICLTITDSIGCTSHYCDTLSAARLPSWLAGHHTKVNVVSHQTTTGIKEIPALQSLKLFPNPSSGDATVSYSLNAAASVSLELYDVSGRLAYQEKNIGVQEAGNHELHLDFSGLQAGTYFVRIKANEHVQTKLLNLIR
ncbi:MAG: PKD domain-containing protein [Bacteroidia bacterium]